MNNKFHEANFIDCMKILEEKEMRNSNEKVLSSIMNEVRNYDVIDFLLKLIALNLNPYNQNKCAVFDEFIEYIVSKNIFLCSTQNKMSAKKFKQLVDKGFELDLAAGIDPIEMPFIQRVQFYGNKWIFSGINDSPGYLLQNLIDVLFRGKNKFNQNFIIEVSNILQFVLDVSTKIVERIGYSEEVYEHYERKEVFYPSLNELNELTTKIIFYDSEFENFFTDDFKEIIFYNSSQKENIDIEYGNLSFYYHPFFRIGEDKFTVLNPSMLIPFVVYNIIKIAEKHNIKDSIVDLYNQKTWHECRNALKQLGHQKLDAKSIGVEILDTPTYKEAIYNASNDGALFVRFFCDDMKKFSFSNMFKISTINVNEVEERWKEILDCIQLSKKERFYQLTIISNLSGGVLLGFTRPTCPNNLVLKPFELYCVSVNESGHPNFLQHYLESKQSLVESDIIPIAEFNYVTLYVENDYSFYINDEFDSRKGFLFAAFGDTIDYIKKALKKQDKQLVEFPQSKYLREIVLNEQMRNIYCSTEKNDFALMIRFNKLDIWVNAALPTSVDELELIKSILDVITFWLSELSEVIESGVYCYRSILIENHFTGDFKEYYYADNINEDQISNNISITCEENVIKVFWTPKAFICLGNKDNDHEKQLMQLLIDKISLFSISKLNIIKFEEKFSNKLKSKTHTIDYTTHQYLKPISGGFRHIPVELEHKLLDEIGYYFLKEKGYSYGVITSIEKNKVCNEIVNFLYKKLQQEVSKYNPISFFEVLHYDLEKTIYWMMLLQRRYVYDIECYPEKQGRIDDDYNQLNKSSIAMKFLLEYITAKPPKGNIILGEIDYEYLLTICSFIIEWANNSDMFLYKMISNNLEILKSGRVGLVKDDINRLASSNYETNRKRLLSISNPNIDFYSPVKLVSNEQLDIAFEDEFSYTCSELHIVVLALLSIGDGIDSDVKRMPKNEVCERIEKAIDIPREKIEIIINGIILTERDDYMNPPPPYKPNDVKPWKYNRRLSFIRRPITQHGSDLIWGNRQVYHSLMYLYDLIANGRLPVNDNGKMKKYLGELIDKRGNDFNRVVAKKLMQYEFINVDYQKKKINGKHIANNSGQDLGDVDILIIDPFQKKIIVIEVKDFSFAKSPYELYQEYKSVFCDDEKKLCYISKHKRRVEWIKEHIEDVKIEYKLGGDGWKVRDALIVDENIVSNEFFNKKQKVILYSDLTEECVKKI